MDRWYEIVWPILRVDRCAKRRREQNEKDELDAIDQANWKAVEPVLVEARRLADLETNRKKTAESKATVYLAALAAMLPLTGALVTASPVHFDSASQWQIVIFMILLSITAIYFVGAGVWSLRTIGRSVHYRLDVKDLLAAQDSPGADAILCRAILKSVVSNRKGTNEKVTFMAMAHEFFVKLFVLYMLLLVFVGLTALWPSTQTTASSPPQEVTQEKTSAGSKCSQPETDLTRERPNAESNNLSELGGLDHSRNKESESDALQGPVSLSSP